MPHSQLTEDILQKQYYTIGEVSRITGVRAHVLRYWESRGKILKPSRRRSRHRLYRPSDIQLIFEIKRLREEEKLTLPAMRRQLLSQQGHPGFQTQSLSPSVIREVRELLQGIREELEALREILD